MRPRSIIHLNVADFAVAVERVADRQLNNRPVIIAPEGAVRAAVYDMSEEAYQRGIRKGMAVRRALRHCPDATVLPPHPHRYERAMSDFLKRVLPYSPLIEMTDHNGHFFVDVTGTSKLFGPPKDVAWRVRNAVRSDLGLDPIWSVASNKLIAKVATRLVKPLGDYIVEPGDEAAFLYPLGIHLIPGIAAIDLQRFWELNLTRAGQVADLTLEQLGVLCHKRSRFLYDAVRGIDPSPVMAVGQQHPKITFDYEFGHDTTHVPAIEGVLYQLVEKAGYELRQRRLAVKRVGIVLDYSDGNRTICQAAAQPATANDISIFETAKLALTRAWTRRVRIRHIRLICDRLSPPSAQQALFVEDAAKQKSADSLITALDAIRRRFGPQAIQLGRTLCPLPAPTETAA
ncbi:MAG: hypothetical protein QNJ97_07025 [Myxococcota bacterium]|nr:hypothetical protein [Myxococcota bacterium]